MLYFRRKQCKKLHTYLMADLRSFIVQPRLERVSMCVMRIKFIMQGRSTIRKGSKPEFLCFCIWPIFYTQFFSYLVIILGQWISLNGCTSKFFVHAYPYCLNEFLIRVSDKRNTIYLHITILPSLFFSIKKIQNGAYNLTPQLIQRHLAKERLRNI